MKQNSMIAMALLAVTLSMVTISVVDFQNAEAAKASGTHTQKYGSATKHKVCGDQLTRETVCCRRLFPPGTQYQLALFERK